MTDPKRRGRKRGSASVRSSMVARQLLEECGLSPMAVMLANMKFAYEQALALQMMKPTKDKKEQLSRDNRVIMYRGIAQEAAKDAAPYLYPRLANVALGNDPDNPIQQPDIQITFVKPDGNPITDPASLSGTVSTS